MVNIFKIEKKPVDFQRDKLSSLLLKFSLPCILTILLVTMFNVVDQIFIGNTVLDVNGSSAVGIVFSLMVFAQGFAYIFGDGCCALLSICKGKNDTSKISKAIGSSITFSLIVSIILAVIYLVLGKQIIELFGARGDVIDIAYDYLKILSFFLPLFTLVNQLPPAIRADGFAGISVIGFVIGTILNVIFDAIFIFGCNLGIKGAAWATVISEAAIVIWLIICMIYSKSYKLKAKDFIPSFKAIKQPLKLGLSSLLTQLSIVLVSLISNIVLVKYGDLSEYGSSFALASCLVETKIFTIVIGIIVGLSFGAQPIIGYNIGCGNLFKVKKIYRTLLGISIGIGILVLLVVELCPQILFGPFGGMDDPLYVKCATRCFRIYLSSIVFSCILKVNIIFFQSCGKATQSTALSLFRDIILFTICLIFLPMIFEANQKGTGIDGVFFSALVTDTISFVISLILLMKVFQLLSLDYSDESRKDCKILSSKPGPIVAICREHGSKGKQIAKALSTKLDLPYYYKDIVFLAAKESGLSSSYIYHSFWNNKKSLVSSSYITFNIDSLAFKSEEHVLNEIADQGGCVILERGASFYLKDRPNLIRVFIYADEQTKIDNVMNKNNMSKKDAIKNIKKVNYRRKKYYESISNTTWGKKENYDLTIDASDGNLDRCVNDIIAFIEKFRRN